MCNAKHSDEIHLFLLVSVCASPPTKTRIKMCMILPIMTIKRLSAADRDWVVGRLQGMCICDYVIWWMKIRFLFSISENNFLQRLNLLLLVVDVWTLSNKQKSILSKCIELHVQNVIANSKRCCDLIFCAIDLIIYQYMLRYVLHVYWQEQLSESKIFVVTHF